LRSQTTVDIELSPSADPRNSCFDNNFFRFRIRQRLLPHLELKGEILDLASCDLLTISPKLLEELKQSTNPIEAKLTPQKAEAADLERVSFDEKSFRFEMNEDPMVTEKMGKPFADLRWTRGSSRKLSNPGFSA
jgi:Transaldolase/Fructose-6-phosphate aldolase